MNNNNNTRHFRCTYCSLNTYYIHVTLHDVTLQIQKRLVAWAGIRQHYQLPYIRLEQHVFERLR